MRYTRKLALSCRSAGQPVRPISRLDVATHAHVCSHNGTIHLVIVAPIPQSLLAPGGGPARCGVDSGTELCGILVTFSDELQILVIRL